MKGVIDLTVNGDGRYLMLGSEAQPMDPCPRPGWAWVPSAGLCGEWERREPSVSEASPWWAKFVETYEEVTR